MNRNPLAAGKSRKSRSPFGVAEKSDPTPATAAGEVRRQVDHDALRGTKADRPRNVRIDEVHEIEP